MDLSKLSEVIRAWDRGALLDAQAITLGIENRNAFVTLGGPPSKRWVLTLRDAPPAKDALRLMTALADEGLPVPLPEPGRDGLTTQHVRQDIAMLIPAVPGMHLAHPNADALYALGRILGEAHRIGRELPGRPHPRNLPWMTAIGETVQGEARSVLGHALSRQASWALGEALPQGLVHGDLFRDNVLFQDGQITGLIDFDHTARGPLLFDLAVAALDWVYLAGGGDTQLAALARGYEAERPLGEREKDAWGRALELAGLRFALSRIAAPKKDPAPIIACLAHWSDAPPPWPGKS
jgi:homoserine kinase type II